MSGARERILVRMPNWTGDVVMATPALRALRAARPQACIDAHLRPGLEPLLDGHPSVDEISTVRSWRGGVRSLLDEGRALRDAGYDVGLCLPDSWSSALLMRAARVPEVVGYRRAGRGIVLDRAVSPRPEWGARRLVARERSLLHLVEAFGCHEQGTELELATTEAEEDEADRLLASLGEGSRFVALAPGASFGSAKRWPAARFGELAAALCDDGVAVAVIGDAAEALLGRAIVDRAAGRPLDLCGRTGLGALKAILRRAAALVCNDAGARHIATAFGTPSVVLFGPTALERTDCNLETVEVVDAPAVCRPCQRRECPIDHRCMTGIDPARVHERVQAVL